MRQRGIDEEHELSPQLLLRDTRTLGMKMVDFFRDPLNVAMLLLSFCAAAFFFSVLTELVLLVGVGVFLYAITRRHRLPFRMPQRSGVPDYNDLAPGSGKPLKARGICFFGNKKNTREELWFNNEDMRTHILMFGSTGSGKTETLVSLAFNALIQGSGFLYVDGKGDNSLFAKVFSMTRSMGREDDLLLINFMTGARDVVGAQEKRLSNTMNPFCTGSSSMLSQLVISLMDAGSQSGDGDMWKGRAMVFVEALMKILVYMRDQGKILLDANSIRGYFDLTRLEAMAIDRMFVRDNQEPVSLAEAPDLILEPIMNYLATLPGFDRSKKGKQSGQVFEQHGFITMQLTRVFGSLADTYGHIIRTNLAEVDLRDVVLNRRVLVVLLPALEKSTEELANLGKVIIASLKAMMAAGLGEEVEGSYRELIKRKPTNSPTPYLCILDEYGYYAVKGFAVVPAQARSLGFSVIFAGQDLPAFQKASKEEAASIGANTNIKICMKLEDPTETWEFFQKSAGESWVTKVDSFQANAQSLLNTYMDSRSASSEKRARIDLLDLKEQGLGEAHILFRSKIVRARLFYANPVPVEHIRVNQFLKVEAPVSRILIDLDTRLERFADRLRTGETSLELPAEETGDIALIARVLNEGEEPNRIERAVAALLALQKRAEPEAEEGESADTPADTSFADEAMETGRINIFRDIGVGEAVQQRIGSDKLMAFMAPLLDRRATRDRIELTERLIGRSGVQAATISREVIRDMLFATDYPPPVEGVFLPLAEAVGAVAQLNEWLETMEKK